MLVRTTLAALPLALVLAGCGPPGRVQQEEITVKEDTPLKQAEKLLQKYAKGDPLGSESTTFEYLANEVKKTDPTRGDILAKGFAEIQKAPKGGTAARAKDVLKALAPKQTPD